jgi:hypothetical protein
MNSLNAENAVNAVRRIFEARRERMISSPAVQELDQELFPAFFAIFVANREKRISGENCGEERS